jgi:hypothetical protein
VASTRLFGPPTVSTSVPTVLHPGSSIPTWWTDPPVNEGTVTFTAVPDPESPGGDMRLATRDPSVAEREARRRRASLPACFLRQG